MRRRSDYEIPQFENPVRRPKKRRRAAQRAAARNRRRQQRQLSSHRHQPHPLRLYRAGRLAELFDVNRATIWRWKRDGVLPPFKKIGGIEGLTEEQVQKVLASDALV